MAQSGYEIRNTAVNPEYGYEDFTYSAKAYLSEEVASKSGAIAVTTFSVRLNIYDKDKLIYKEPSPDQRGMGKNSFIFGPYNFKDKFGISSTENASYQFILYVDGQEVADTGKINGPIVQQPALTGTQYQYGKTPYFFQGISIKAGFKDMDGLSPTCHIETTGPLESRDITNLKTGEIPCIATGKSSYSCTLDQDLSAYRNGGNFSFILVYSNLKLNPMTFGPYNITLRSYSPSVERLKVPVKLDYTNFTIQAYVNDEGVNMVGGLMNSTANLIVSRPQKGEARYSSSEPTVQGKRLVYEWTSDNIPALFNKSDVQLSKNMPFQARLEYKNENWNYGANSSNYNFTLVNVTPLLTETHDPVFHMTGDETALQKVRAFITYAKGMGDLKIVATGSGGRYENILKGSLAGVNKYEYDWSLPFNKSQAGNYNLSFTYIHDSLDGGFYEFDQKPGYSFQVVPIFIEFQNGSVSLSRGRWNSSYSYTVEVNSSVEANAILQIYNPCSSEWADAGDPQKIKLGASSITLPIQPFAYNCDELNSGKYRFRANYLGNDFPSTRVYEGPQIINDEVKLVSPEYSSPVYVPIGSQSEQTIRATVKSPLGSGKVRLGIFGPNMNFNETKSGTTLGDDSYQYEWKVAFNDSHVDHNYTLSLDYQNPDLPGEYPLGDNTVQVKPLWISFGGAGVEPGAGRWNDTYLYSVTLNRSVETELLLEVYDSCLHEWVTRARLKAPSGSGIINMTTTPLGEKCPDAEGKVAQYRFAASFMGQSIESDVYYGPSINGGNGPKPLVPDVIGTVNPKRGVSQAWQESDKLYAFTYSAQLQNLSSGYAPWVELLVKAPGSSWKSAGEKQQYDPAQGNISWTVKPFFDKEFLGMAEFKFLIDGVEGKVFKGPEIVAIYKGLNYDKSTKPDTFNYFGRVNASINLTIDLLSSDDNVQWKNIGKPQKYTAGSGEVLRTWNDLPVIRYFEFDFKTDTGGVIN